MSKSTFEKFYSAFQSHDAKAMAACYHKDVIFNDPAFRGLNHKEACAMWEMLIQRSDGNLSIEYHSVVGDDSLVEGIWEAKYQFSKTGNAVHNIIHSSMKFKDGLIVNHTDEFNFWRWSKMALGTTGLLLGWTPFLKGKVQKMARKSLESYLSKD